MNTLQERLGVAVESDAARYSGADFAATRGASIAGRVRRRRTVRAAGYGGGAMLAVGVLAVGGARMPWGVFGDGLDVGASDCVPASAHASAAVGGVEAETVGTAITFTHTGTGEELTFRYIDGSLTTSDGGGTSTLRQHEDSTYSFSMSDGTEVVFLIEDGFARIKDVEHPASGAMREVPLTTVTAINVPNETGGSVVTFAQLSTGEQLTAYVNGPGVSIDEVGDGPPFLTFHEEDDTYSLDFTDSTRVFFTADGETATMVRVVAPAPAVSASPSEDCLTPEPSASASPSPSIATGEEVSQTLEGSPFDIGFEMPSDEYGTADLFIGPTEWLAPEALNDAFANTYQNPADAPRALGTDPIPQVVVTERAGGQIAFAGGAGGPVDPEVLIDRGVGSFDDQGAVFVQGAAFVAVRDGVVVGVLLFTEDSVTAPAAHLDVYANSNRDMLLTLLNPTGAFVDASGVAVTGDYDVYAVAGAGYYDQEGTYSGSTYAWRKLDAPPA